MMTSTALKVSAVLLLLAFFSSCARVPYTERKQLMMVSEEDEARIGVLTFEQIKAEAPASASPEQNALVSAAGRRIAQAAERPDFNWEFLVINDRAVNAFALPGGKVAFFSGIFPVCRDETGVAVVMGHEVAHVLARHGAERLSQQQILSVGRIALMAALMGKSPAAQDAVSQAYGLGSSLGVLLPFSRTHESEADKIGLILMAKAGYDPRAAVDFWKRMSEASEGKAPPELLSTHPSDEKRIKDLEDFLPIALDYYTQTPQGKKGR